MNRGSDDFESPTNPYRLPNWRVEPPTRPAVPPPPPQPPPAPRRASWVLPAVVGTAAVVLVAGGTGGYLLYTNSPAPAKRASPPPTAAPPDPCAMVPDTEAERLAPGATVTRSSRDAEYNVVWSCRWVNDRISYGEFWRSREIEVKVLQHKGERNKTGRSIAQRSQESDLRFFTYKATAKQTPEPGEKTYYSKVTELPGVGDGGFAQYTWSRSGTVHWYAFGEGRARVGDMTIEVKYQAGQQRKDAGVLTNKTARAVTEENAVREVKVLLGHMAKGVAGWQAEHPGVLAAVGSEATSSPTPEPTPSPTVKSALPAWCRSVTPVAARLVPSPATRARETGTSAVGEDECRWLNLDIPADGGVTRLRSVLVTAHTFTNRAGGQDVSAAKGRFSSERGSAKSMASTSLGGYSWGRISDLKGLGDEAFTQYLKDVKNVVHSGGQTLVVRSGSRMFVIGFSGAERLDGEPTNSPKVTLMPEKESAAGALEVARAVLDAVSRMGS